MFLLLLIPELVKRKSVSRKDYREIKLFRVSYVKTYYFKSWLVVIIIIIDQYYRGKAFSSSSSFLPLPENDRSKKRAQLTFRKAQQHAKENRIKGYRASVKKGGPPEFDIGTRQIHAYLEAFALLIKGGPGPRPRASKRRAAKKRGARGRRRRRRRNRPSPCDLSLLLLLLLSGNTKLRRIAHTRASTRVRARVPSILRRYETNAPLLCKFMRVEVCASLGRGRPETATTHIGYWVIGYTSVLVGLVHGKSCTRALKMELDVYTHIYICARILLKFKSKGKIDRLYSIF